VWQQKCGNIKASAQESSCSILKTKTSAGVHPSVVYLRKCRDSQLSRRPSPERCRNNFTLPYERSGGTTIDTFPPLLLHVSALAVQYSVRTSVHSYSVNATLLHICGVSGTFPNISHKNFPVLP
jgi:hypothetical protein